MLKKKEMMETEYLMASSLIESMFKKPAESSMREIILKKIAQKVKDSSVDEPPPYLSCPISFVRETTENANLPGFVLESSDHIRWPNLRERIIDCSFQAKWPL